MLKDIFNKITGLLQPDSIAPLVDDGNLEKIRACIEKGADLNLGVSYAKASLYPLEDYGNVYSRTLNDFVLSEIEGRVFCTEHWFDITPLMIASYRGRADIVKLLIKNGADVNRTDSIGLTAISYALFMSCEEIVKILLENRANTNAAVHVSAALRSESDKQSCDRYEVNSLDELLRLANSSTVTGLTPVFFAVAQSTPAMVQLLTMHGANVNVSNKFGETPLEYAMQVRMAPEKGAALIAAGARYELAELEEKSTDSDKRFSDDFRPRLLEFLLRAESKDEKSINQLYSFCQDYKDNYYTSIYELAAEKGFRALLRFHFSRNSDRTLAGINKSRVLRNAVDSPEITELLLEAGFGDGLTEEQWAEIFLRALAKHTHAVPDVLRSLAGKMKSYCCFSGERWSTLWSGGSIDFERAAVMLDLCPDINVRDAQGNTVLIKLATSTIPDPQIAKMLFAKGIDVNARNNEGNTALIQAVKYCRASLVALLLAEKADFGTKNGAGKTALQIATGRKQHEIIAMLKKAGA